METVYTYLQCTDGLCAVANVRFLSTLGGRHLSPSHLINPYLFIVEEVVRSSYEVVSVLTVTGGWEKDVGPQELTENGH